MKTCRATESNGAETVQALYRALDHVRDGVASANSGGRPAAASMRRVGTGGIAPPNILVPVA